MSDYRNAENKLRDSEVIIHFSELVMCSICTFVAVYPIG